MPTLREVMLDRVPLGIVRRGISGCYDRGFNAALRDYGDYEIVEGKLVQEPDGLWQLETGPGFCDTWNLGELGNIGDHIKLLVPPKPVAERDQPEDDYARDAIKLIAEIADRVLRRS